MSDLFGNHIIGFATRWLISWKGHFNGTATKLFLHIACYLILRFRPDADCLISNLFSKNNVVTTYEDAYISKIIFSWQFIFE